MWEKIKLWTRIILFSAFSCAITAAPLPASPMVAATLPPVNVVPAAAIVALPPVCSGSMVVLIM